MLVRRRNTNTHTDDTGGFLVRPLAAFSGGLAVLSVFWPDWIEALTGYDPDHHNGTVEWLIVIALFSTAPYWRSRAPVAPTRGLTPRRRMFHICSHGSRDARDRAQPRWKVHMRCADGYREGTRSMRRCVYRKIRDAGLHTRTKLSAVAPRACGWWIPVLTSATIFARRMLAMMSFSIFKARL
jgi:hypothetical protein